MANYLTAKGWLTLGERQCLFDLAKGVATDGWLIGIGVEYGASLVCLREGNPTAHLVGIDLIGDSKLDQPVNGLIVIKGDSTEVAQVWGHTNLVFVDGGHSYNTVLQDATLWGQTVIAGGIVAFHDTAMSPAEDDVNRAVSDWLASRPGQFHELPQIDSIRAFKRV